MLPKDLMQRKSKKMHGPECHRPISQAMRLMISWEEYRQHSVQTNRVSLFQDLTVNHICPQTRAPLRQACRIFDLGVYLVRLDCGAKRFPLCN